MRIPDAYFAGGFGQRIERPRAGAAPDMSAGQDVAKGVQNLGAALLGNATQQMEEQGTIELIAAREQKAEIERQEKEREAELKRLDEARTRSVATTALVSHENTLVQTVAELEKDPNLSVQEKREQFKTLADQTKASFMGQVPELYQYAFGPTFDEHRNAASANLDTALGKQISQQAKAGIYTTLEQLERSPKPLESKLAILRSIPDEVWQGAGIEPAEQTLRIQGAAEKMSRAEVDHRLNNLDPREVLNQLRAKGAAAAGKEASYSNFQDLDVASREAYIATAKSRIHAQEQEAERQRRERANARDRLAEKAFDEYKDARTGLMQLSPTREAELWRLMNGTDYAPRAKEVRRSTGSISFIAEKMNKDPLTYGAAQRGLVIPPLDSANPQTWQPQLKARAELAAAIKRENNLPYLPVLKNEEATNMAGYLKAQSAKGQVESATGFLSVFGRESTERVAGQFAATDAGLGMVVALVANDRPGAAYHVANGDALAREKVVLRKPQADDLQARLDGYLGDALTGQPQMRGAYSAAVKSAYLSMAASEGNLDGGIDDKIFKKAAEEVVGTVAKVNGKRVLLPTGVDEHAFKDFFRGIGADTIKRAGGVTGYDNDQTAADVIRGSAQLYEAGNGRYRFTLQGKQLVTKTGAPFELTVGYHDVKTTW